MLGLVQNNIAAFKKELDGRVTGMLERMGSAVAEEARRLAPVRTGQLRDSIGYTIRQSDKTVQIHADVRWAYFVEFGTRSMAARPFLRPALLAARNWQNRGVNTELQFPAIQQSARPMPYPRANPAAISANDKINAGLGKRFKGLGSLVHKRPSVVFHGRTGRSQTGRHTHAIHERFR